ncbi:hypothetical protein FGG08_005602 [Glutinoglossum americanum]|uniref:Uncharacterized protein n=1 Tax=Glutinoglossum americanum TaxID=1670608 RepID=A0A9P8I931_9PEZI|nr:hypothetical protein FGG08_005602 [Glutinoglossum americanum]
MGYFKTQATPTARQCVLRVYKHPENRSTMSSGKAPEMKTIGEARMDRIVEIETALSELRAARQRLVEWYQEQDKVSLEQLSSSGSDARRRRGKERTEALAETAEKYEAQLLALDMRIQSLEEEKEVMRGLGLAK